MLDRFNLLVLASLAQTVCYEGEGGDAGGADGSGGGDGSGEGSGAGAGAGSATKTFTQDDVNKMLANDKRKHQAQLQKVEQQLQALSQNSQLSEQERTELQNSLEDVRKQLRTKEQQAAIDRQTLEQKYNAQLKEANDKAAQWETRYTTETIGRALTDAAAAGDAFNPSQVVELLRSRTKMVDGKPMVDFPDVHADTGEAIVTQLTPSDAVKRMREIPATYGNLFKTNVVSGIGGGSKADGGVGANGKVDVTKLSPEQYRKLRAENPRALGL